MKPLKTAVVLFTASLTFAATMPVTAQDQWPSKPITYVVPYPPAGTTDILGRMIAQKLESALKATIIVENKPGATGTIGTAFVVRAAPDGYTILGTSIGPQAIVPSLMPKLSYDPVKSLQPVSLIGTIPHVLVVSASQPYKALNDVIKAAKAKPGSLSFASGGNGTILQMQGELLKMQTGADMLHIPYKGDTPAMQDVLAGHVTMMFAPIAAALPHIQSGKLRALAVTSSKRIEVLPAVQTMAESGVPDFEAEQWQAIYVPANTPKAIVQRLNTEVVRILKDPEVAARFDSLGVTPVGSTPEHLANVQKADNAKWSKVIRTAGIKAE
jgi:tripartite-type tricarboxylate transporter receptor subunit TctC